MKSILIIAMAIMVASCATAPVNTSPVPQEVKITIDSNQPIDHINVRDECPDYGEYDNIRNPHGELSMLSFITENEAFVKIFSGLSVSDVTRFWNDCTILEKTTDIRTIHVFINSPGGDAFAGLALADQIERAQRDGFTLIAHASGIIASAAVPVFAVCDERLAAPGTIFMVHEAALWKWPGRETASDIRSQNDLMELLEERYIDKLVSNSNLTKSKWLELEKKTTWFSAEKAMDWGLVDKIE